MKALVNLFGLILGMIAGGIINMLIITNGSILIPNPEGFINTSKEGMLATIHLLEPKHFLIPWFAHAIGTFLGALIAFKIARNNQFLMALIVCIVFFIGGSYMVTVLPSPTWFNILDLGLAYIPMAWFVKILFLKKI